MKTSQDLTSGEEEVWDWAAAGKRTAAGGGRERPAQQPGSETVLGLRAAERPEPPASFQWLRGSAKETRQRTGGLRTDGARGPYCAPLNCESTWEESTSHRSPTPREGGDAGC